MPSRTGAMRGAVGAACTARKTAVGSGQRKRRGRRQGWGGTGPTARARDGGCADVGSCVTPALDFGRSCRGRGCARQLPSPAGAHTARVRRSLRLCVSRLGGALYHPVVNGMIKRGPRAPPHQRWCGGGHGHRRAVSWNSSNSWTSCCRLQRNLLNLPTISSCDGGGFNWLHPRRAQHDASVASLRF